MTDAAATAVAREPILRATGVSKVYGAVAALGGIDFELYAGEVLGIVGDNGAGKSTFIKILSGAIACVPSLAAAQVAGAWSNFRPHAAGDRPLIGPSPMAGLFLATGHYRNGILLSKVTADAMARVVVGPAPTG